LPVQELPVPELPVPDATSGDSVDELVVRLAGSCRAGTPTALAADHLRRCAAAGTVPLGLKRLCATMAGSEPDTERPEREAEPESDRLEDVLARHPCVVLRAADTPAVATGLGGLLAAGARLLVVGDDPDELAQLRAALPEPLRALCIDEPLPLDDDEQRELRMLLLTETEQRRGRAGQWLPPAELVPTPARLAELGVVPPVADGQLDRHHQGTLDGVALIPHLFAELPPEKASRLLTAAHGCRDALRALIGKGGASWSWPLLERLSFGGDRAAFDWLLKTSAAVVEAADSLQGPAYRMVIVGPPPPDATERLTAHIEYLESGGSTRKYFASDRQRSVVSLLRQLGIEAGAVGDVGAVREALTSLHVTLAMRDVSQVCSELGIPEPTLTSAGVRRLRGELQRLVEAADAVGTLRHEVLFIHPTSPVAVPDLAVAEAVGSAIVAVADALPHVRAELAASADALRGPQGVEAAPEALRLAATLSAGDLPAYRQALNDFYTARSEQAQQARLADLLGRVHAVVPELAAAWHGEDVGRGHGSALFVDSCSLLDELPTAESVTSEPADVVLLLGAHRLGPENLLAAAAATRLVAVCAPGSRGGESVASMLLAAGAPRMGARMRDPGAATPAVPLQRSASPDGPTTHTSTPSERASA
jgi:hypothetical protein